MNASPRPAVSAALLVLFLGAGCRTPAPTVAPSSLPAPDPFVSVRNGHFFLDGRTFRFTGVNTYSLMSAAPGTDGYACGKKHSDAELEKLFYDVRRMGGTVIRLHAFQSFTAGGTDYDRLDLLLAKANRHGIKLILALENQWADCTQGGYKEAAWYRKGYRRPYGGYRWSYRDHVADIVGRYKDEPGIMMWQLMNEAEARTASGKSDPDALLLFATDMGALIKRLDGNHPVSLGTIGGGQPGTAGMAYLRLAEVPWIDVIEAHDYGAESDSLPEATRGCLRAASATGKPCFIGEIGVSARQKLGRQKRAEYIGKKLDAAWVAGVDGVLIWSFRAGDGVHMDLHADDPLIQKLRRFSDK